MLPTNPTHNANIVQTRTRRAFAAASSSDANGIGIVTAQPSAEQMETVDLVMTCTAQYTSDLFPHLNQPCHHPITVFDERGKPILHRCDVISNIHLHSTQITQRIAAADNPIPAQATQQMELLSYDHQIVNQQGELVGFLVTQTSSALYATNAPAHAPREVEVGLHSFQEICTLQDDDHHTHSITRPVFIPLSQAPISLGAFGFCRHLSYDTENVEQNPDQLPDHQSYTASTQGSLPYRWKDMGEGDKQYYMNDIAQCFDFGATCRMIARRHCITVKNVRQILVEEAKKTLRSTREEKDISMAYRSDRGNILGLPELTRPPLRLFLEDIFTPHQARLTPCTPNTDIGSTTSYSFVQKRLKTNDIGHATWCFPRNWELAPNAVKDRYINDICACYEKKATYNMIAKRHSIRSLAVRGILLLKYKNIRSPRDERVLTLNYADLASKNLPGIPVLDALPEDLLPLQHHLALFTRSKKRVRASKAKQPAFANSKKQTAKAPARQVSNSPVFAGTSQATMPSQAAPQEAMSEDDFDEMLSRMRSVNE